MANPIRIEKPRRPLRDPKQMCDAQRLYSDEARRLLKERPAIPKGLPPKTVEKLRIMAIRKVSLPKMEERTGIPKETIWEVVNDIDLTQPHLPKVEGLTDTDVQDLRKMHSRGWSVNRIHENTGINEGKIKDAVWASISGQEDKIQAREIIQNGGNAKQASMQTGLPFNTVRQLEDEIISERYKPLKELIMPTEGPSLGEVRRIMDLHHKGVQKFRISARTGRSVKEIGELLETYSKFFPKEPVKAKLLTPNEEILGVPRHIASLIDVSKVFQKRYGKGKMKTAAETAKELGMTEGTVGKRSRYKSLFPEYVKKVSK
jgi:hypothetical protein